jgi:nitrogen-specific signal transduction histidine kinase
LPDCLVCSRDEALLRRLEGFLAPAARIVPVESPDALDELLGRTPARVVILDLQTDGVSDALSELAEHADRAVFVALGVPGSDPAAEAEARGLYAVESADADRLRLRATVVRALAFLHLREELRHVRRDFAQASARQGAGAPPSERGLPLAARHFPGARRDFGDVAQLLQSLVEDVGTSLLVSRAGIFCRGRGESGFRLRAALRCLPDTRSLEYEAGHPLVQWLALHAHVVTRANLDHVTDVAAARMLADALDQLGAEVIVPLQSRDRVLGWLFAGHRATGLPYETVHLENMILVADLVSTLIENALLYEEMTVQKTLAETLLHAMPTGIVAAGPDGMVRWFNQAAREILEVEPEAVLGRPVEALGSLLADGLRRALAGDEQEKPREWVEPRTRRRLALRTRCIRRGDERLGAMALLQDRTQEWQIQERQERVDRAAFWAELAASMSHEIRNPLVAIKTFAQLLPERYSDAEFRTEFSTLVSQEVDRLNRIIDQITEFAHPPPLVPRAVDVAALVRRAADRAPVKGAGAPVRLETRLEENLPAVRGDEAALTDTLAHLLQNAVEALAGRPNGTIWVSARLVGGGTGSGFVEITVRDNGPGIAAALRAKVFSPFCTTKARGLGLGLPIVKRTVVDHNGTVSLETGDEGTTVVLTLPAARGEEAEDGADANGGR